MPTPRPPEPGTVNVGPREPLSSLIEDFKFNQGFRNKVKELIDNGYVGWRRVRGDGNCFYRAVGYGFLELLVTTSTQKRSKWICTFQENLRSLNFKDVKEQAANAELVSHMEHLRYSGGWEVPTHAACELTALGMLYQSLRERDGSLDLAFIRAMRHLCAKYLVENKDSESLAGGISVDCLCTAQGYNSTEDYCQQAVLPMGIEAEGVSLGALSAVLGTNIRIAFLDRAESNGLIFCDYSPSGSAGEGIATEEDSAPLVHVQLRPGHYDLVYCGSQRGVRREPTFAGDDGLEYALDDHTKEQMHCKTRAPQHGWCL